MPRLRRLTALVLNVLLIQVSLAGYWPTCVERGEAVERANTVTMAHDGDASHDVDRSCGGAARDHSCPLPWAPAGCSMSTACGTPALPASASVATTDSPTGDGLWGDLSLARPSPRPAPDLPPPRA